MIPTIPTLLGWVGMGLLLFAYWRRNKLKIRIYGICNLLGAILIGVVCVAQEAWPPLALQVLWGLIAIRDVAKKPSRNTRERY